MQNLPDRMNAVVVVDPGPQGRLVVAERPLPELGPNEILVRVGAAGVNRPDVMQRHGQHPPPASAPVDIPGLEIAGEVVRLGPGAALHRVGDRVTALVAGGGYADYCKVHESNALPVPDGFSLVEAAAIPETFFTVWPNVFDRGRLAAGETVLVHGGTSGIGTTAIQLATAFGARVIATAGSAEKCAACVRLGASEAIDYREQDFVARVAELTGGRGADVIVDVVGGSYAARNYEAAAEEGRIVQIGLLHGARVELDLGLMLKKRLTHVGSALRHRPVEFKAGVAQALRAKVWPLLASRKVAPLIDSTFPLARAAEAQARMESSQHIGKIVLTIDDAGA